MVKKYDDNDVKKALKKINVMILGSGWPKNELTTRRKIKQKLKRAGINAFIMEDEKQAMIQITHVDKFVQLLKKKYLLCVAIITKSGDTRGVTFEIGYLCGHHGMTRSGKKKIGSELGFLFEKGVDRKKTLSSYLHSGIFIDVIKRQNEFSTIDDIIQYVTAWTKNRAVELHLL
jgi:hypothetical protein